MIDIGTNSVKLLVADVSENCVSPVLETSHQTRLGQGFFESRFLLPNAIADTAAVVAKFTEAARNQLATCTTVIATSAAREAQNANTLIEAVRTASGQNVEIISGDTEARLAFLGIITDPTLKGCAVVLMEVGGGSTQFIIGSAGKVGFVQSFSIGSVRMLDQIKHGDPPTPEELEKCRQWLAKFFAAEVQPKLGPSLAQERLGSNINRPLQLLATGGTASILGCMEAKLNVFDRAVLETTRLSLARVEWHVANLWSLSLAERRKIIGLPPNRADIILNGAAIYEAAMREFGLGPLRISTRGLRFGAVLGRTVAEALSPGTAPQ